MNPITGRETETAARARIAIARHSPISRVPTSQSPRRPPRGSHSKIYTNQRFTASVTPAPQPHPKRHPRPLLLSLYTIFQLSSFTTRFPSPRFPRPRFLSLKLSLSLSTNYPLPSLHQLFRVSINL